MGTTATLVGMTAFQRLAATTVVPVSTSVQTFLPIVLEPVFLRERWGSANLGGAPIAAGLVLALIGCALIARSRAVSARVSTPAMDGMSEMSAPDEPRSIDRADSPGLAPSGFP